MRNVLGRLGWICIVLSLVAYIYAPGPIVHGASSEPVYVIPVENTIEQGLESFLDRAFTEAEEVGAKAIILDIDTFGGSVEAADGIGKRIRNSDVPVIAFIQGNAVSAGAYIALNADQIIMTPGSSMGAAEVRDLQGEAADPKVVSVWASKMVAAAELNGRQPEIAQAMVDRKVTIPGVKESQERPLTLTSTEAKKVGYAEEIKSNLDEVLAYLELDEQPVIVMELSPSEVLARWVTNPFIVPLLLILGLGGIIFELLAPGFAVPGLIGITSLGLFFFGHYIAGFAGVEHVFLFIAGLVLMIIEVFAPGFGIFGFIGIASLILGVVLASYDTVYGMISLGIALVASLGLSFVIVKYLGHRGTWNRLILRDEMVKEKGYVAAASKAELMGKRGKSITPLRPAGTVMIHGQRIDAVTEGNFIPTAVEVEVVQVEWNRVVVRQIATDSDR
jgi:membrane-bound serine protease (ClpP class)